jgi:Fe-Mn family superoxide dismutase
LEEISSRDADKDAYAISEMQRRFSFEFNGMRNHEIYFQSLEGGTKEVSDGELKEKITETWGSFENWLVKFKTLAKTRGIGWAILYFDKKTNRLLNSWVDEQHLGQLNGCESILALDMWEHSFVADYQPSGKGTYIDDFFTNLNWEIIENNFNNCKG